MIENFEDVANYFCTSENDEKSLNRAIYKNTNCGAWLKFLYADKKMVNEKFHAMFNPDPSGKLSIQSIKAGGQWDKNPRQWFEPKLADKIAKEIRIFLGMSENLEDNNVYGITWEEIKENSKKENCPFILHGNTTVISFSIQHEIEVERFGIQIGTIVEGADAEPESKILYFPFKEQDLNDAILELECEAGEIWQEWNKPNIISTLLTNKTK